MRILDKLRAADLSEKLVKAISSRLRALPASPVKLMEVCGTHTVSIFRSGLRSLLPPGIVLLSGPGCPVCVTPTGYIDHAVELCRRKDIIIATFGDMIRVPGSRSSLEKERAKGARVQVVYSVVDALKLAESARPEKVVFLGVGFETTAPSIAAAILEARRRKMDNFFVLSAHKLIPPAMKALIESGSEIDAFICPGHVSTIIGARAYVEISNVYKKPCVIAGFEPLDVLRSILMILDQMAGGVSRTEIQYLRAVKWDGNETAQRLMQTVFEPCDAEWRGLGIIPRSGLRIRDEFEGHDATKRFQVDLPEPCDPPRCLCGQVLRGLKFPTDCGLFARVCTPATPVGPCMVSSEGTCSAYFKYGKRDEGR